MCRSHLLLTRVCVGSTELRRVIESLALPPPAFSSLLPRFSGGDSFWGACFKVACWLRRWDSSRNHPDELPGAANAYALIRSSAICTALVAAPLRRLSLTHQNAMPLSLEISRRMRPTKTSSCSVQFNGIG